MICAIHNASPAPSATTPMTFENFLTLAASSRDSRDYALSFGIDEQALLRYADGAISDEGERGWVEHVLTRNKWSRRFVIDHVRSRRIQRSAA